MTEKLQPTSLSIEHAARILTAVGGRPVSAAMIACDTDNGAPVNTDGTINLIYYAAWLVNERARERARGD